jgi:hypothetical protein
MRLSEYYFRFSMIGAISLLATAGGLVVERFVGLNRSTLMVGPLIAVLAVLIWRQSERA